MTPTIDSRRPNVLITIAKAATLEADLRSREADSLRSRVAQLEEDVGQQRAALLQSNDAVRSARLDAENYHKELSEMKWKMLAAAAAPQLKQPAPASPVTTPLKRATAAGSSTALTSTASLGSSTYTPEMSLRSQSPDRGGHKDTPGVSVSRPGTSLSTQHALSMMRAAVMGEKVTPPALSHLQSPELVRATLRLQSRTPF